MKIEMCDVFFYRIDGDNLGVFKDFNTCHENVLRNNNKIKFYVGEWVKIKVNDFIKHHVRPAETLKDIAKQYGIEVDKILIDNNLKSYKLFIGQTLKICK